MISIQAVDSGVVEMLDNVSSNLEKELRIVSKKTARRGRSLIAKVVTKELAVTQRVVREVIEVEQLEPTVFAITLKKNERLPLKAFKPKQTRRGVSVRISKQTGRKVIPGAFMGPSPNATAIRLGGHVFKRKGKGRLPILKLRGASPWAVFVRMRQTPQVRNQIFNILHRFLEERLRYRTLKSKGSI